MAALAISLHVPEDLRRILLDVAARHEADCRDDLADAESVDHAEYARRLLAVEEVSDGLERGGPATFVLSACEWLPALIQEALDRLGIAGDTPRLGATTGEQRAVLRLARSALDLWLELEAQLETLAAAPSYAA